MEVELISREGKRDLITLDLLGGCTSVGHKDLDLGLKASFGCHGDLHPLDLNVLPDEDPLNCGPKPAVARFPGSQSVCTIEQVKWALERAERESRGRETMQQRRQRRRGAVLDGSSGSHSPSSSSSSITTASIKRRADGNEGGEEGWTDGGDSPGGSLVAAGCPSCLSYVLISEGNRRCPRCESQVPLPVVLRKRARIDLNCTLAPQ